MSKEVNLFTVVVTYNGMRWYKRCFDSLCKSNLHTQIIVVDNASTDDTINYISTEYPDIIVISNDSNLGFAQANNIGIKYAVEHKADYVFLLNQDAWLCCTNTLDVLVNFAEKYDVGIISPMHLSANKDALDFGFVNCVSKDAISDVYLKMIGLKDSVKDVYEIDMVNAAAWLLPISTIKDIGLFDTTLFLHYNEDDNYCHRVTYHKKKIYITPFSEICHDRAERTMDKHKKMVEMHNRSFEELEEITYLANINIDTDEYLRSQAQKHLVFYKIWNLFNKKKAQKHKDKYVLYVKIIKSRELNRLNPQKWLLDN